MRSNSASPGRARWIKRACLFLFGVGLFWVVLQWLPPRAVVAGTNAWRCVPGGRPLIIAHGGGQGLHPPNTLAAFRASGRLGCDVLETDLRLTRDGVLVTLHDETIDRTSDGSGRAIDFTLAELKEKNFGAKFKDPTGAQPYLDQPARLATLEELLQEFPGMRLVLELKDRGADGLKAAKALSDLLRKYERTGSVIVASFDDATLLSFQGFSSGAVATATPMDATQRFLILTRLGLDWFASAGFTALQIPVAKRGYRLDFPALVGAAHRRNMAVHYWTINEVGEMRRLIALGADGIMTDRPDLLLGVLREMGYP